MRRVDRGTEVSRGHSRRSASVRRVGLTRLRRPERRLAGRDAREGPNGRRASRTRDSWAASGRKASCCWPSRRRVGVNPRRPPRKGPNRPWRSADPKARRRHDRLMEEVCERENLRQALKRVEANEGAVRRGRDDRPEVAEVPEASLAPIREPLLAGTYRPQPVKRVEIPKPDGGVRKLGIPTVLDRFIQQAVLQVLASSWDRTFSEHSYGFRPRRIGPSSGGSGPGVHRRRATAGSWTSIWRSSSTG